MLQAWHSGDVSVPSTVARNLTEEEAEDKPEVSHVTTDDVLPRQMEQGEPSKCSGKCWGGVLVQGTSNR